MSNSLSLLVSFRRLTAAGLSNEQARTFLDLLLEAKAGRLNPLNARHRLIAAGYTEPVADTLIEAMMQYR